MRGSIFKPKSLADFLYIIGKFLRYRPVEQLVSHRGPRMANGFYGKQEEWERFEHPLRRLDGILERFASDHGLVLRKNERNWPDRSFQWGDHPNILIQVFLESEKRATYTMWVSASDQRSRAEYWMHKTLLKAVTIDELEHQLPDLLEEAYTTATEWIYTYDAAG